MEDQDSSILLRAAFDHVNNNMNSRENPDAPVADGKWTRMTHTEKIFLLHTFNCLKLFLLRQLCIWSILMLYACYIFGSMCTVCVKNQHRQRNTATVAAKEGSFLALLTPCSLEIRYSVETSTLFPWRRSNLLAWSWSSIRGSSRHPFSTRPSGVSRRKTSSSSFLLLCFICGGLRVPKSHVLSHACDTRVPWACPDPITRDHRHFFFFPGDTVSSCTSERIGITWLASVLLDPPFFIYFKVLSFKFLSSSEETTIFLRYAVWHTTNN